jgi:hypothetical protein
VVKQEVTQDHEVEQPPGEPGAHVRRVRHDARAVARREQLRPVDEDPVEVQVQIAIDQEPYGTCGHLVRRTHPHSRMEPDEPRLADGVRRQTGIDRLLAGERAVSDRCGITRRLGMARMQAHVTAREPP